MAFLQQDKYINILQERVFFSLIVLDSVLYTRISYKAPHSVISVLEITFYRERDIKPIIMEFIFRFILLLLSLYNMANNKRAQDSYSEERVALCVT